MSIVIDKIIAPSPNTERGRPTQLSCDPKGERIAYASGKSVFVRNIDNPSLSKQYVSHTTQTTVARFSPSGYYVASGDVSGSVKVWDSIEGVNTKGEYNIISGRINDIAWDGDSQRIIAVGDGRERYGHCITADTGNSVGEIIGHSGIINTVSIRQQRPLRAATGSDDSTLVYYHGAPFKFNSKLQGLHKGYIYGVAFSPDGNHLVSVGSDKKIQLYDGKTGLTAAAANFGEGEHKGTVFGVSWSKDSRRIVTASADQTVKLWDIEAGKAIQTWRFGEEGNVSIPDHQVGVTWPARNDGMVISLSLSGDLNYLAEGTEKPTKVVQGHGKAITAIGSSQTEKGQTLWTGSFDGRVCSWDIGTGVGSTTEGSSHTNQVSSWASSGDKSYSVGWDDTLRTVDVPGNTFLGEAAKLNGQPKGIASSGDKLYIATSNGIDIFSKNSLVDTVATKDFTPTSIAAYGSTVAVGDDANAIHIYTADGNKLSPKTKLTNSSAQVTALEFSPKGDLLAAGNSSGKIYVYDTSSWQVKTDRWGGHTARITSIDWNEAGTHAVSGGLDTNVFVWSLASPGKRVKAPNAHKDGVAGVCWIDGGKKVASVGGDAAVKFWAVSGLA
ncbi:WD domain-containing protein [Rutstroemia sp. NJR-2017a BVV2]|nr:WD domain-containing protein [Rutstroemia sp. NJR-2017a BVV2]